jgi:heme-degrading monooxygenase HmoA
MAEMGMRATIYVVILMVAQANAWEPEAGVGLRYDGSCERRRAMIGRMWRGRASRETADGYEEIFKHEVRHELDQVAGYRGAYLLRRDDGDGVEFVTLTLFDSLDAVRAFAGDQYEAAVVLPAAQALLRDYDRTASHYEVEVAPDEA